MDTSDRSKENALLTDAFRELIRKMPGGLGVLHLAEGEFYLDFANSGWARAHRLSDDDARRLCGARVTDCIFAEDRPRVLDECLRIEREAGGQGSVNYRVRGEDGGVCWLNAQFCFAYEAGGQRYYYASCTDTDKLMRAEEKLADSQAALREAVSNSDIQFFTYFPGEGRCQIYAVNNRLSELPLIWNHYPGDFLAFAQASPEDCMAYRGMLARIDRGEDEAECTVRLAYHGIYAWERMRICAIRDAAGRTGRAQGYSINVTDKRNAEERLRRERVRLKALEGGIFEAFSFNLTKKNDPDIQTRDTAMLSGEVDKALLETALRLCPTLAASNPATLEILLRAAARIPDSCDRERFILSCCDDSVLHAASEGRYHAELRYRRRVGESVRWVSSRSEVLPDPYSGDLYAFFYTRDIDAQVIAEKLSARLIGLNYETVAYCDLQTGQLFLRETSGAAAGAFRSVPYDQAIEAAAAQAEDPDALRRTLSLDALCAALEHTDVSTFYFTRGDSADRFPLLPKRQMKSDAFYLDENRDILVCLLTDVTEIFEHERENREKMASALLAAEQASAAKSNFLSRMSHEIRTPLNAIIGMDAIAAQSLGNPDKVADCISKIGISARYLLSLINDILDMSRIESGKMLLKNEKFLFRDFINNINTMIYNQAHVKNLDYECTVSSEVAEAYIGDAMKLQQVLINILGNAVKFTNKGKVSLDIHPVSAAGTRSVVRFTANDTGIGIHEEFLPHIFEPFEQADTSTTSTFGGTGLGLAITKNLVGLMGGSIRVRSIEGVGSEFTVDVPLTIDESILLQPKPELHFEKMHTLIVDDDLVVCEQTSNILRDIGMVGEWVTSGREAVDKVAQNSRRSFFYDFILVDWKMPDMGGIETTHQIRRLVGPDVTIIIISAYDWESIEAEAKAAGANMLVSKPLLKTTLISAFQRAMGETESARPQEIEFDFTGRRLLVAEDNQINAEIAKTLLESKNFEVEIAENGLRALELYTQHPAHSYDAILMDIRMPLMDGLQATTNIRHWSKEDAKTIPIVAMTANAFDEDVDKSKAVGMNAHLSKPIEPQLMYATLYRMICEQDLL